MLFGIVAVVMIVGGKYMPGCALFAVPNLWVIVNTFRSFFIETINKIRKGIAMIINRENLSDRQELDRINFSNMNERVLLEPSFGFPAVHLN